MKLKRVRVLHATSNITWAPWSFGKGGTTRAAGMSKKHSCPHLQVVAVRGLDLNDDYVSIVAAEEAWGFSSVEGVLTGQKRLRDLFLFGTKEEVALNNSKLRALYGDVLIGHSPFSGDEPFLEISPRVGASIDDLLSAPAHRKLVLDSYGLMRVPTVEVRSATPGDPLAQNENAALMIAEYVLTSPRWSGIIHFQPWRKSKEALLKFSAEEVRRRLLQLDEYLSGDPKSYLYRFMDLLGRMMVKRVSDSEIPREIAIVYEIEPKTTKYLRQMVGITERILSNHLEIV